MIRMASGLNAPSGASRVSRTVDPLCVASLMVGAPRPLLALVRREPTHHDGRDGEETAAVLRARVPPEQPKIGLVYEHGRWTVTCRCSKRMQFSANRCSCGIDAFGGLLEAPDRPA